MSLERLSVSIEETSIEKTKEYKERKEEDNKVEIIDTFNKANIENTKENPSRLIVGYSGLIPTKYREPLQSEIETYKKIQISEIKEKIANEQIIKKQKELSREQIIYTYNLTMLYINSIVFV